MEVALSQWVIHRSSAPSPDLEKGMSTRMLSYLANELIDVLADVDKGTEIMLL